MTAGNDSYWPLALLKLEEAEFESSDQREKLEQVIRANMDIFALDSLGLGSTELVTHSINTGTHPPIRQQPRQMPFSLSDKVTEQVQEMLDNQVITPSNSPWAMG